MVYMVDIFVVVEREELTKLCKGFTKEFPLITMVIDNEQSYLGVLIKVAGGEVSVDMHHYLDNVFLEHDNLQVMAGGREIVSW